jgi:hypothetical protein
MGRSTLAPASITALLACVVFSAPAWCKKPKGAEPPADPEPTQPESTPTSPGSILPSDLNIASMRISALDTLYEFDLSPDQLEIFAAAIPLAAGAPRTPPKPNEQLTDLFTKMQAALLAGKDDQQIAALRNQIIEAVNSNAIELDDAIRPTAAAHRAAQALVNKLKASQFAAFIAMHADEVADPVEMMMATVTTLHDAKSNPDMVDETLAPQTAAHVGYLVAGMDDAKAKAISEEVAGWLKAGAALSDQDFAARRADLEAEAKRIVGSVMPMEVLQHYLQQQIAILLSNPEAGRAIHLMLAARKDAN